MTPNATAESAPSPDRVLRRLFLTLFLRGRSARGLRKSRAPQSIAAKLSWTLVLYFLVGGMAILFILSPLFQLALYLHGSTMVFCGLFIAASAGEVLFNKEEADILLHRPVTPAALLRAKILVLLQVSLWLAGAFNLAGMVMGLYSPDGTVLFPFVHALSTVLEALFCTSGVVLGYELCLRFFGRERLESVITSIQVLVAIGAVLAGQVPRLFGYVNLRQPLPEHAWWLYWLPPGWFAGFDDALAGTGAARSWMLGALGTAVTVAFVWLALVRMARHYEKGLQMVGETAASKPLQSTSRRWLDWLVRTAPFRWWLRHPVNRAAFLLTTSYLLRDRDVKLRIYPALAPMLVMPIIFLLPGGPRHPDAGTATFGIAFAGAYLGMAPLIALNLLEYSQQWQASDVFRVAPMPGPGRICAGARQAVTCFLTLPLLCGFAAIVWLLHTDTSQFLLLLPGLITLPLFTLFPHLGGKAVPFTKAGEEAKSARRGLDLFVVMLIAGVVSTLAVLSRQGGWFAWLLGFESAIAAIVYTLMRVSLSSLRWDSAE